MKIFILILFILTYILIIALPRFKVYITGASAIVVLLVGGCTAIFNGDLYLLNAYKNIDLNVILMLLGVMITVAFFSESNMPNKLADRLVAKLPNTLIAIVLLCVLSGVVSAFLDNVATVLMLAPIGLAVSKKAEVSPIPVIISIAVSSNLQGAATLVGDTTSVMLGGAANMSFFDFFFMEGRFSIFWAVELGALATIPIIVLIFRKNKKKFVYVADEIQVKTVFPSVMLLINLALLVASSFITDKPDITNGLICITVGIICLIYHLIKNGTKNIKEISKSMDFETVIFLVCLFILIGAVKNVGIIDDISSVFAKIGSKNIFLLYTLIVGASVIISAFIDNIPYVATMLPVITGICASINAPHNIELLLFFGLLIGATLGGNITPVGASANVVGIGILNKRGYKVKTSDFLKIGIPFTFIAVFTGYLFCWFVWAY